VVGSLDERDIIFAPDANLASYVQKRLPHKRIIPVPAKGYCYVHENFTPEDVKQARERGGKIICHPECSMEVQDQADEIASTGGMIRKAPEGEVWSVFTEKDMVYRLKKLYPEKTFYAKEGAICYDMKKITLQDLHRCLQRGEYEVTLPADVMERARGAIERMISLGR
jgi:quinolinate synthase